MAQSVRERGAAGIAVLPDLPDDEVFRLMHPLTQAHCDIPACRDHARAWLRGMLAALPASGGAIA